MALVKDVSPGDVVTATGWDVAITTSNGCSHPVGYLVPHGMNHKAAVAMGYKEHLFYIGPVKVKMPVRDNPGFDFHTRKLHHFLTGEGKSVCLEGHEFRHFSVCTNQG